MGERDGERERYGERESERDGERERERWGGGERERERLLPENTGYTQWLLFLLSSVHAGTMSKLPKEMSPSLSHL